MDLNINLTTLFALFIGIILGAIILFIYYFINVLICKKKSDMEKSKFTIETINSLEVQVRELALQSKYNFKEQTKNNNDKLLSLYFTNAFDLIQKIASLFYKDSKRPLGELTVREVLCLDKLIINDIESLLPSFVNKAIYSMKLTKLTKKKKEKKKNVFNKITNVLSKPINIVIKKATNNILTMSFGFISQETFKIYSGKAFDFYSYEELEVEKEKIKQAQPN